MIADNIKTEHLIDPIGIDITEPLISWTCAGGLRQTAYEVKAYSEGRKIFDTGKVLSGEMSVHLSAGLKSRQRVSFTVRLYDENDVPGEEAEGFFEMAFTDQADWKAGWIRAEEEKLTIVNTRPASYLRKSFTVERVKDARLYATAHGLYVCFLNGKRVGDRVLAPGTSEYAKRLEYQTYDVTDLLKEGKNEILVILGDGWYRGKSGMNNVAGNLFGDDISFLAQLESDKKIVCVTDESWEASQEGPIRVNGLDFGERVDAGKGDGRFALEGYHPVVSENFGYDTLVCSNNVPVKEKETFKGKLIRTPKGQSVIDFGQNMAGYTGFTVTAKAGQKIRLVHGETLTKEGNFTIDNFQHESFLQGHPEKGILQEVTYICREGLNEYRPNFSIFGFQYLLVEADMPVEDIDFTAYAVYSDMEETGFFECGNADVNKLFSNSLWSMKGNFCDIPTDCPTRERQGWTGDCGVFAGTGVYLMDCYPVLRKWLNEVRLEQLPDGKVPGVAPKNEVPGKFRLLSDGSAGWADAIGIVPNVLAETYNCTDILEENYEAFKKWVAFTEARAKKSRLKAKLRFEKNRKYIVDTGFHWGEWLEPGVDRVTVLKDTILKGAPEVPTAYYAYSAQSLSFDAGLLGKEADKTYYADLAEKVRNAYRKKFLPDGEIHSDRQAAYVRPVALNILTDDEKKAAVQKLNDMVIGNDYHLNTGFLSTPNLCHVLTEYGYTDTAYRLLLQDTAPGWLYEVKKGATTIWETWDGKREDGSIHDSLNHYSYGAVAGWLFKDVCGINLSYGRIRIEPHPDRRLGFAKGEYRSPVGLIRSAWHYEGEKCILEISIPANCTAELILPWGEKEVLRSGDHVRSSV